MKYSTYTCVVCGKPFQATQRARYCSPACKAYVQNHKRLTIECPMCGKLYETTKQHPAKFCSPKCLQAAITDVTKNPGSKFAGLVGPRKPVEEVTRICIDCGEHFQTKGHSYVNRRCPSCLKEYKRLWGLDAKGLKQEISKGDHTNSELMPMIDRLLEQNDINIDVSDTAQPAKSEAQTYKKPSQTREEVNARRRALRAKKKALGQLAEETHDRTGYRKQTLELKGTICSCCGYNTDIDAIQVHHLDLDRENNRQDNLVVLCANCHTIIHKRIKKMFSVWEDKKAGCIEEYHRWKAELKERNEAGKPDRVTRTEGSEESESGATHSDTSSTDMNHHEAAPDTDSWDIQPDLGF